MTKRIKASLVLGSGGARGFAHIGVIRAINESGRYEIAALTGTSIGALIGGLYAADKLDAFAEWVCGLSRADVWRLLDFSFTSRGLVEGDRLMEKLKEMVGERQIQNLSLPFTAVASDIERRQEVWLDRGSLFAAIRASIAIPGFFTPVEHDGRLLVDGGLMSPLPLAPTLQHGSEQTIAVSLNGASSSAGEEPAAEGAGESDRHEGVAGIGGTVKALLARAQAAITGGADGAAADNLFDTVAKSIEAMQDRIARYQMAAYRPDLLIEIPVDSCGVLDFHRGKDMIALGERAARAALDQHDEN